MMERFTEWDKLHKHGMGLPKKDCYTQLAKYEDSGYTPEEIQNAIILPCKIAYFICEKGTKDALVMSTNIESLRIYEINGIDKKGYYWSSKELAEKEISKN